jgi:hypothetical protein
MSGTNEYIESSEENTDDYEENEDQSENSPFSQ